MKYEIAKDTYDELKNFEGKATFKGEDTVIDLFVLMPKSDVENLNIKEFIEHHKASGGFEIEGRHEGEEYTILGISIKEERYTDDTDYFMQMIVW
jgi:hypothetical protein